MSLDFWELLKINFFDKSKKELYYMIKTLRIQVGLAKRYIIDKQQRELFAGIIEFEEPNEHFCLEVYQNALAMAKIAYQKAGGKLTPSIREKRAKVFDDKIDDIKQITLWEQNSLNPQKCYRITFVGESVLLNDGENDGQILPLTTVEFLARLRELEIGAWNASYFFDPNEFYIINPNELDGNRWDLEFLYHKNRKVTKSGNNCYPHNFTQLHNLLCNETQ